MSEKDRSLIVNILDETYCLFDLEKLGWSDNYTVEIKRCWIDKSISQTDFIYFHPDRKFWGFGHHGNFHSLCLCLEILRFVRKKQKYSSNF